jgi:hypothetical protein
VYPSTLAGLACRLGRNSVVRYFGNILTFAKRKYANQLFSRAPLRRLTLHWQKHPVVKPDLLIPHGGYWGDNDLLGGSIRAIINKK